MQLEHRFTVPVPPDVAWEALLDPERVAPCFPGATVQSVDGPQFTGTVKVRLGPIALLYKGKGRFTSTDAEARRTVIEASGKDSRGNGTATANVAVTVRPDGDGTTVDLVTDLTITGRPAQLGRGLIADVGGKIVNTFAECLAERLAGPPDNPAPPDPAPTEQTTDPPTATDSAGQNESAEPAATPDQSGEPRPSGGTGSSGASAPSEINLIEVAGAPVLKRIAPALLATIVMLLVLRQLLRRRQ